MDDLQDAILDAQYIGAMVDDKPKPTKAWSFPPPAEVAAWRRQREVRDPEAYSLPTVLNQPLGLYLFHRYMLQSAPNDYEWLQLVFDVIQFKDTSRGQRAAIGQALWAEYFAEDAHVVCNPLAPALVVSADTGADADVDPSAATDAGRKRSSPSSLPAARNLRTGSSALPAPPPEEYNGRCFRRLSGHERRAAAHHPPRPAATSKPTSAGGRAGVDVGAEAVAATTTPAVQAAPQVPVTHLRSDSLAVGAKAVAMGQVVGGGEAGGGVEGKGEGEGAEAAAAAGGGAAEKREDGSSQPPPQTAKGGGPPFRQPPFPFRPGAAGARAWSAALRLDGGLPLQRLRHRASAASAASAAAVASSAAGNASDAHHASGIGGSSSGGSSTGPLAALFARSRVFDEVEAAVLAALSHVHLARFAQGHWYKSRCKGCRKRCCNSCHSSRSSNVPAPPD
jgi:hypothetical protein